MYNINQSHLASIQLFRIFQETLSVIFAGQKNPSLHFHEQKSKAGSPRGRVGKASILCKGQFKMDSLRSLLHIFRADSALKGLP